ncbi:MAG TPA: OmpA family protein [Sandaracinaceae bacterium LLY-WYZ-13_1]|nr:OmpA family protein [Sandaracinaceae bacterium LLY-WYZ-13_1]
MRASTRTAFVLFACAPICALALGCGSNRQEFGGRQGGMTVIDPPDVHVEEDRIRIDRKIHFAFDSDEILDDSTEILDHIAETLDNHPEITAVRVIGHTDAAGGHAHNQDLSERRAAAVVRALRQRGVSQTLESRGVGETEPLCQEDTDECHARNRRVEFVIAARET